MVIDKTGKIAFKGYPVLRNLDDDLELLQKAQPLQGEGTEYPKGNSGGSLSDSSKIYEEGEDGFTELDHVKINNQLT